MTDQVHKNRFIDIDRVIASKNPALAKRIPNFVVNYLKRVSHQDELNKALDDNSDKKGVDFLAAILKEFEVEVQIKGLENFTPEDRYLVASNHPLGGLDGITLMYAVGQVRQDIQFPVNDLLMNLPNLTHFFIPVNKHGSNTDNMRIFDQTFESDNTILYFPAGLVSRKQKGGIIKDLEWKKTFITKTKKSKRNVIPTFIDGVNSDFFYNLARLRKFLGIKANIEMLYLVDEMYSQRKRTITITFGKPIPYSVFDKRKKDNEWAECVKDHVYEIGKASSKSQIIPEVKY